MRDVRGIVDSAIDSAQHTLVSLSIPANTLRLEKQAEGARALLESEDRSRLADRTERVSDELDQLAEQIKAGQLDLSTALTALLRTACDAGWRERCLHC